MATQLKTGSVEARACHNSVPGTPTFSVAAEDTNAIVVTITLKNLDGTALSAKCRAAVWISDTAGAAPTGTAPNGATSITTGTQLKEVTTKVLFDVISTAAGVIGLTVTETTAKSFYVNVAVFDQVVSQVITFA